LFHPKVLFATHYHELNEMAASMPRIKNFHVSVKEAGKLIIFMRKLEPGGSEHSFGIHVARMAGMPNSVLERANQMLGVLEKSHGQGILTKPSSSKTNKTGDPYQLSFIQLNDPLLEQIAKIFLILILIHLRLLKHLMKLKRDQKSFKKIVKIFGRIKNWLYICTRLTQQAKVAQLVEHDLAKVRVAGSSPVFRSKNP
jgi:DNA mismatch repair protein MutS